MPGIRLTLLISRYPQIHHLSSPRYDTLRNFRLFVPGRFPLVPSSPLNFRWQAKNPWFISEVLPELRTQVRDTLGHSIHFG
jgi:uracil-DNA glycosylase